MYVLRQTNRKLVTHLVRVTRTQAHLGVMKRAVGAPITGFARASQH